MPLEAHVADSPAGDEFAPAIGDRSALRTGLAHAFGPLIIMFAGPTLMDILGLAQISPYPWPPLVTAVQVGSALAGAGWLLSLAVRHPAPDVRRWQEIGLYTVLTVECCVGVAIRSRDGGAVFEVTRAALVLALIARLAYLRTGAIGNLAPGEDWRRPRSTARGWILTAAVMTAAILATFLAAYAAWAWFSPPPASTTIDSPLHDWALVLCSAPVEELVSVAAVVSALEYAARPAWQIYAVTITARIAFHLHYGLPAAFALAIMAAAATWAYRKWRQVTPLIVPHLAWDIALTIASLV